MVNTDGSLYYTVGDISRKLEEPPARVAYVIAKYRIREVQRCGILRLFSEQQVEVIKQGLFGLQVRN